VVKRMRVFAGPNGSGKSSIIKSILNTEVRKDRKLDFGIYINADDIVLLVHGKGCNFNNYEVTATEKEFVDTAKESGLINTEFSLNRFRDCISVEDNILKIRKEVAEVKNDYPYERIAQITADFLRKKLLSLEKKFSFETVFSHRSKIEIIKQAKVAGYKVYLYFVSTEHPDINDYRVNVVRAGQKGHVVSTAKIKSRYYRSMELMYEAAQYRYQVYFFDNSEDGSNHTMFAHFKVNAKGKKVWDDTDKSSYPNWFKKYYSSKVHR
jgi:predicted ABC-type ATPase